MLRAKEARLITREQYERMLTEPNFAEVCRVAADAGYEDMSEMDVAGINDALERHLSAELAEMREMVPDKALVRLFSLQYDCHNAKVLVKSGGDADKNAALFSGAGCYSVEDLKLAYDEEDNDGVLPPELAQAIREAAQALARTGNPQQADYLLDKAYFALLLREAVGTGRPFLAGYVRNRIDKVNLRSLLRTLNMGRREELLSRALIEGGNVGLDQLSDPGLGREDIERLFAPTIFDTAAQAEDVTAFEKAADNAEQAFISGGSLIPFGPEVTLEYAAAVENEAVSLRIILTGKRMGISGDTLRERLRECYV